NVNIYNSDGTQTSDRTFNGNSHSFTWNNNHGWLINGDDDMVITTNLSGGLQNSIFASTGGAGLTSSFGGRGSDINLNGDTTRIRPSLGILYIDTLKTSTSSTDSVLVRTPSGQILKKAQSTIGAGGTVTNVASADGSITVTNPTTTVDLAVVKSPKLTTARTIGIATGDATSTGSSFDGTANNTNALTLATVNSNVGSFTNASITVNGKGLITAASNGTAGTVTNVATGYGLSGGTITTTGTLLVDSSTLSNTYLRRKDSTGNAGFATNYQLGLKNSFWNASESNIFNNNAGNVGIGTSTFSYPSGFVDSANFVIKSRVAGNGVPFA
ncbi:MAG TPA: hypothetical protein VK890_08990, partial [Bacteroidia bacterium]|nr:hypothetical protein [Bacteroidia bacterium]